MGQAKVKRDKRKALEGAKEQTPINTPSSTIVEVKVTAPAKKILIDVSRVPPSKREDPRFKSLFAMMERKLADPQEVEAICIHESMHVYYLIKSGVDDFIFTGPTITYDETKGFDYTGASVQAKSFNVERIEQKPGFNWAFTLGKAAVGGGLAVEKLCPEITDTGDSGDHERFDTVFEILVKAGLSISKDEFKKQAERLVRAELDTIPGLKDYIRKIAEEFIKDKLFTWV